MALVIILHKPFDAMAVSTLMAAGGSSRFSRHVLNGLFALVSPLGAVLFYFGASHFAGDNGPILGRALAFCAGSFLCIASSDLLPELQFHSHDRFKLSVALLGGLGIAYAIGALGGRIWATSEGLGRGASIHLALPLPESETVAIAGAA